ncbi:MAG: hypothetical protein Q3962_07280 [Corynebacterium sp.]|nr:hypothetical protein [Corynebacterium sp.]
MKTPKLLALTTAAVVTLSALATPAAHAAEAKVADSKCTVNPSADESTTISEARQKLVDYLKKDYADRIRAALVADRNFTDADFVAVDAYDPTDAVVNSLFAAALDKDTWEKVGTPLGYFGKQQKDLTGYEQYRYQNWADYIAVGAMEKALTESGKTKVATVNNAQNRILNAINQDMLTQIQAYWKTYALAELSGINSCLEGLGSTVRYTDESLAVAAQATPQDQAVRQIAKLSSGFSSGIGSSNWVHIN